MPVAASAQGFKTASHTMEVTLCESHSGLMGLCVGMQHRNVSGRL